MNPLSTQRWMRSILLLSLLGPATGHALVCKTQGSGQTAIRDDLSSSVAIPASVPNGEVVWRSERLNVQVECAKDGQQALQEEIFIYLNPDNLQLGQGIRAGVTLNGVDHVQSSGRLAIGQFLPACHEGDSNIGACPRATFNLAFSVFIQKFGATPPSGVASDLMDYPVFQLAGSQGPEPIGGRGLSYVLNNLNGLRFVACDAELQVVPETLEFGAIGIQQVAVGKVFARQPFSLVTRRSCDSPFSLNARFRPVTGTLSGNLLVPGLNPSLGIQIVSARGSLLRYNEPFHLAQLTGNDQSASVDFNAELVWTHNKPMAGPFEAEVMVDLFYK
ncbi:fimbrial protein [Pseudomonas sp. v388]|uniref:fimbrial protein n=1 Tax=Pseudomonas sp. v388 TaxID=2479849 RepID=UPI000F7B2B44|nr:fimbrial protein [Pseudomonas sp. v388]RRV08308.1 fimbrial protein [Pseudomonas sp. v388]